MTTITDKTFDEERALYAAQDILVKTVLLTAPPTVKVLLRREEMLR